MILPKMSYNKAKKEEDSVVNDSKSRYSYEEDMAIIKYITENNRYLRASGIAVWKEAVEMKICPGRPYLSLKERYRKVIVKNLRTYNVEPTLAIKIMQFMTASQKGKSLIRLRESAVTSNYKETLNCTSTKT